MSVVYDAQARYLCYSLAAACMLRLPDEGFAHEVCSDEFADALSRMEASSASPALAKGVSLMREYVAAMRSARAAGESGEAVKEACRRSGEPGRQREILDELAKDRTYLFRALGPGVGAPPAYETHWRKPLVAGSVISELTELYRSFGMEVSPEVHERADYLGVELAFMMHLVERELGAKADDPSSIRLHEKSFFSDHLVSWVPLYLREAEVVAKTGFFKGALLIMQGLMDSESEYFGAFAASDE